MNSKALLLCSMATFVWVGTAVPASAEIVVLTSSRTLSVKSHRIEGDSIVLTLRSGGEVTCDKSLIDKILPDEVTHPEPKAEEPAATRDPIQQPTVIDPALLERTP
ncbi:MAG: hypothetical protein H0U19_09815, partial [Acidobacteria bacterium]|nr:hypothetical protein [Acidobacteriota bacterium]